MKAELAIVGTILCGLWLTAIGHTQEVPTEVKQAIAMSIKASNSPTADDKKGGFHEEGGMWGQASDGSLIIMVAKPGPASPTCNNGAHLAIGDSQDPSLAGKLVSISGEWHVHPRGVHDLGNGQEQVFAQPPSAVDIQEALAPVDIVIGARDNTVYFYNQSGVTSTKKLKEFLR